MALKDMLNSKSSKDDKPKKKKSTTKKKPSKKSKLKDKIVIDPKFIEYLEDMLRSESPPSKVKHSDNLDRVCELLTHQIGEWLKCFALVGYTDDGKAIELGYAPTPMDEQALDGAIHNLYAARAALNGIEIKNRIQQHFTSNNDEEQ